MPAALSGLRVLEWGEMVSAPYCAKVLADLGADVVKLEDPRHGDYARRHGPFPRGVRNKEKSGLFLYLNTNKKSVTLSLKTSAGRRLLFKILKRFDVLVVNQPGEVLDGLNIDYQRLRRANPRLIVASITPFGDNNSFSSKKAYEINCAAISGLCALIGEPDRAPLVPPLSQCELQAGSNAAAAVLAALVERERSGLGQIVDVSVAQVMAYYVGIYSTMFTEFGLTLRREGHRFSRSAGAYPYTILPCKDGAICLAGRASDWDKFVEVMGSPGWSKNPRYQDLRKMGIEYPDEVDKLVSRWLKSHTKAEIWKMCLKQGIPYVPIRTIDEVVGDEHFRQRGFFIEVYHPQVGRLRYPGAPYKLSRTPWELRFRSPLLGEHNEEVYCEMLGFSKRQLNELVRSGVV